jgi:hypothetical protein
MSAITFVAMPTDVARAHQAGVPDANGQKPELVTGAQRPFQRVAAMPAMRRDR